MTEVVCAGLLMGLLAVGAPAMAHHRGSSEGAARQR
jgi:hypothetical protein